jgi:hypothetical protein
VDWGKQYFVPAIARARTLGVQFQDVHCIPGALLHLWGASPAMFQKSRVCMCM